MADVPLRGLRAIVSGAGVAGPALAWWLGRYGAEVTVVEVAPALRAGGFAVDFRGPTHLGVLRAMGVLDDLYAIRTHGKPMCCVDADGAEIYRLPADFTGGELEVYRRDLSRVLYEHSAPHAEYVFGDSVTGLAETTDGMRVEFADAPARTVDIVIGADGIHSAVRRLAFGPETDYVRHLDYYIAGWGLPNTRGVDRAARSYNVPGRAAVVAADGRDPGRAEAMVVFASPPVELGWRDVDAQKRLITERYAGLGWHVPWLLAGLADADELYFDAISRVRMPGWYTGRTALLGDAAWGVTLGGMGVGTGVVGASVLTGELALAGGDHRVAFPAYQRRMRAYAGRWQRGASPGHFLAPATATGLRVRNTLLRNGSVRKLMLSSTKSLATTADLPDYPRPVVNDGVR